MYSILYTWIYFVHSEYDNFYLKLRINKNTCFSVLASLFKNLILFLELFGEDFCRQNFATYEIVMIMYILHTTLPAIICRVHILCFLLCLKSYVFW